MLFEQLQRISALARYQRFRSFNYVWRSRLWWLSASTSTAVRTYFYLQRRYRADWLAEQTEDAIVPLCPPMLLDPIAFALKVAAILTPLDLVYYVGGSVASSLHSPHRKPKAGQLSEQQKAHNRALSASRVMCENAFAGVKRYGAVSAVYRNRIEEFDDHLMLMAAGLWNFYLMAA